MYKTKTKMEKSPLLDLIRNLQALMTCPSCGARYNAEDIQFIGQVDLACLLQMNCVTCSLPVLATVLVNDEAPGKRKLISDFAVDEIHNFGGSELIKSNDIIEVHQFLKVFDGDFEQLFAAQGHSY